MVRRKIIIRNSREHMEEVVLLLVGGMGKIWILQKKKKIWILQVGIFMLSSSIGHPDHRPQSHPWFLFLLIPASVIQSCHLGLHPISYTHSSYLSPGLLPGFRLITRTTGIAYYLDLHLLSQIPSTQVILTAMTIIDYLFAADVKEMFKFSIIYMT